MEKTEKDKLGLSYLFRYLRDYRGVIALTIIFLMLARAAATIQPFYLKKIIEYIPDHLGNTILDDRTILNFIILYFGYYLASFLFEFLRDYVFAPVEMGIARKVSEDVFRRLLALPISYHYDQKTGSLARRISRGAQSINFVLDFLVISILPTVFELLFVTIFLARLYPAQYSLITLGTIILYAGFTIWTTEFRQKYRLAANMAEDESSAVQVETITNIDTVKYFGNENYQKKRFHNRIKEWFDHSVRSNKLFAAISAGQAFILMIGFGLIVLLAVNQSLTRVLTVGDLVLLTTYIVRLAAPIATLGFVYRRIKDGFTDLSSMGQIFNQQVTIKESKHPVTIPDPKGAVEFKDVQFKYGQRSALAGLTLNIPAGKKIAIVGPSGAGKSTIVKLLFRLYDPDSGEIAIDDVNVRNLSRQQFDCLIALVPQEPILFNESIGQNIKFGKVDASREEVAQAVSLANLNKLIARLPEGLDTIVGERGVKLSGGEKQRVAIARAIIRDPKILVFDEATSNLDAESEKDILKSIHDVSSGRTTISIAHRLPTITDSDIIFVIDNGKLAEQGTHETLLKKNGVYAKLWQNFVKE
ncbi:MAG TPA: ABC transporter transmembrane domain-containing protein [bacterium]|nr:ABC transporter transmembrane domain-containing protein [bacterium]